LEGVIVEPMEFLLDESEANGKLLQPKGNSVSFWQADYKNMRPMLNRYDVIVADFRYKNSADHLSHIAKRLKPGGLLILGSIDDVNQEEQEPKHILKALRRNFEKIEHRSVTSKKFAHIYRQTRNKCQYAISNLSVWRKLLMEKDMKLYDTPVEDLQEVAQSTADYYEDENILDSYDQFHFGEGLLSVKNFPLRMAEICISAAKRFNINKNAGTI
jgi:SAM-dependent methyltransferase